MISSLVVFYVQITMFSEVEAFKNCFLTFPSLDDDVGNHIVHSDNSSHQKYGNDIPVVILLGWAGCKRQHLKKYSAIYATK